MTDRPLDAADPAPLAYFYKQLLEADVLFETDGFIALKCPGILLTVQQVEDHRAPDWPAGALPKQIHLELSVDDLDAAEAEAVALGARRADEQPSPDRWRVLIDPSGHPFCITTLIPET